MRHNADLSEKEKDAIVELLVEGQKTLLGIIVKTFDLCEMCVLDVMAASISIRQQQIADAMIESNEKPLN